MEEDLKCRLDDFNQEKGEVCSKMARTEDGQLVVVVCTLLMKRVHSYVKQSVEIFFSWTPPEIVTARTTGCFCF